MALFAGVPYAPGNLTAVATSTTGRGGGDGAESVSRTLLTAGTAAALSLSADAAQLAAGDRNALAYVSVQVVDAQGVPVPAARVRVRFSVLHGGGAELAAVGSGDPSDTSSFFSGERVTWRGRALAVLRPLRAGTKGNVTLVAQADGLPPASVTVDLV